MKYVIWCMDTKTDQKWKHVDASKEKVIKYSSKKQVTEEVKKLNRDYAHTFYTYWHKGEL